ncbi:hypothetical protein TcCL_NonESM07041 [Trypanosoma cruzi]|nr:hypothetical protein TcCL_NonESM07041 [Trypanosoma cruzi]
MWSRTVSPASTEQGLPGASVTVAGSIDPDHGTPPKDVDTAVPERNLLTEEKWIRPGYPDRPREASLGGRDRSSETDGEQARPRLPVVTHCCCLSLSAASSACLCCRRGNTLSICGVVGVALQGDCASFCVACNQHWKPNRKRSISMGLFLHMHVLCVLRLTLCLKLVILPMSTALLVLVADVGPPYGRMALLVCLLDFLRRTYTKNGASQMCAHKAHTRISKHIVCVTST